MSWLTGYNYRKSITLSRASGAVTNYQMKLLVGESSGATGEDIDCASHCLSSFNDIRFTTSDGTTLLDYWIESISGTTPNQLATIWIEFNSIGTGATIFYMYYGNAGAAAYSNGPNTFIFHDHFDGDMSKWSGSTAYCSIASSIMTMGDSANWRRIYGNAGAGVAVFAVRGLVNFDAAYAVFGASTTDILNRSSINRETGTTYYIQSKDGTTESNVNTNPTIDALKVFDVLVVGGTNVRTFESGVEMTGSPKTTNPANSTAMYPYFATYNASTLKCDWVLLRQYLATEPAWGTWGSEEPVLTISNSSHQLIDSTIVDSQQDSILAEEFDFGSNYIELDELIWDSKEITLIEQVSGTAQLVINNSSHALTSDNVVLYLGILEINNALHALTSDNLSLTEHKTLSLSDSTHALVSDNLALIEQKILAINNSLHDLTSENITLRTLDFYIAILGNQKTVDEISILKSGAWKTVTAANVIKSGAWEGA